MAKYSILQIQSIILNNPNKGLVDKGKAMNKKLMMHLHGVDVKGFMKRDDYFENADVYKSRNDSPCSNKDMFARILNEESLIFAARGGSSRFGLSDNDEKAFNTILSDVAYGLSLRKWMQNFALPKYRSDPMGLIFMETEELLDVDGDALNTPKCYPTYKSIQSVFDYNPNGRNLEYVCFQLSVAELDEYGINEKEADPNVNDNNQNRMPQDKLSPYFRFVDDEKDIIVKKDNNIILIVTAPVMTQPNPVKNDKFGGKVPAFIISDLFDPNNPKNFESPVSTLVELADSFLYDRSIRDLQKKYHGFAKAIEPMLKCTTCSGTGQVKGTACPDCTPAGQNTGLGYKLRTKVSDVARFPMTMFDEGKGGFDWTKIFGYSAPPIETWDKQDLNLQSTEQLIYYSYWGCSQTATTSGPAIKDKNVIQSNETATKTIQNVKPKYARLNATADWVQSSMNKIADFLGIFWFDKFWKGSSISLSRNYILESPEDLREQYNNAKKDGMQGYVLTDMMLRYLECMYQDNPLKLARETKLFYIDPFPHDTADDIEKSSIVSDDEKLMKRYFDEWIDTKMDMEIIDGDLQKLKDDLKQFVQSKKGQITKPDPVPGNKQFN